MPIRRKPLPQIIDLAIERAKRRLEEGRKAGLLRIDDADYRIVVAGDKIGEYLVQQAPAWFSRKDASKASFLIRGTLHLPTGDSRILKFPNPAKLTKNPALESILQHEDEVLQLLEHRNIVRSYPAIRRGQATYLPMEELPLSINEIIGDDPNTEGLYFFAVETASAVNYLRSQQTVHGDIKPAHFRGNRNERGYHTIKLLDFTVAYHPLLKTAVMHSTARHAAPEIVCAIRRGNTDEYRRALTHKSDIYSLGITYALVALSGKISAQERHYLVNANGHNRDRLIEAMRRHDGRKNPIKEAFTRIVESMTATEPAERIDAEELTSRLLDFKKEQGVGAKLNKYTDLYTGEVAGREVKKPY